MSKNMTAKDKLLARVQAMQKQIVAASEEELTAWADKLDSEGSDAKLVQETEAIKDAEKATVSKSTGVDAEAAADGQNARANANWPMSANMKTARKLAALASREANTVRRMLALASRMKKAEDCEEDDEMTASMKLTKLAMKRSRSAATMLKMARKTMKACVGADEAEEVDGEIPVEARGQIASRLVAIAKNLMGEEEAPATEGDKTASTQKASDGKEIAAALLSLAKSLSAGEPEADGEEQDKE